MENTWWEPAEPSPTGWPGLRRLLAPVSGWTWCLSDTYFAAVDYVAPAQEGSVDFPLTRALIDKLPGWVEQFASLLPPPVKVPFMSGFRWEHQVRSPEVVQLAKAVRMASGLRAAISLADLGFTTECGAILRMVSDYADEILFLAEGLLEGRLTAEQQQFVEQHFSTLPTTPDELAAREREYYVGRGITKEELAKMTAWLNSKAIQKAEGRMADRFGKGYDAYVHGHYTSAMETV